MGSKRLSRLATLLPVLLVFGCGDWPTSPDGSEPQYEISDGPRGGTPYFFWLQPMVSTTPSYSGAFDGAQPAVVEINRCNGRDCSSLTKIATSGVELPMVAVIPAKGKKDPYYTVQWRTRSFSLDINSTYRVQVRTGPHLLGYADVWLVQNRKDLSSVDGNNFVPLINGNNLDINFRIEQASPPPPPGQPPVAAITSPADGAEFVAGTSIPFQGSATDPEDGPLSGDALVWTSSRDGQIGTGASFTRTDLSMGTHTITLTATDSQGLTGTASVSIQVVAPPAPPRIDPGAISAGKYQTSCGITASSAAYCWGYNGHGNVGNGTWGGSQLTPVRVDVPSFARVSVGFSHTCGITPGGTAYCWGYGPNGELGMGNTPPWQRTNPTLVAGNLQFKDIVAGYSYTCGITTDDLAYCWGSNSFGRLGDGTTDNRLVPTPVASTLRFAAISAGTWHTCALTTDKEAYCWGVNNTGNLGNGTTVDNHTPTAVSGGLQFTSITAGERHSCGITPAGDAHCWGGNSSGQLGNGTSFSPPHYTTPQAVVGGLRFSGISAGTNHTCGVTTDEKAYCWGHNSNGELGDGSTTSRSSPGAVSSTSSFAIISAGHSYTCALTVGRTAYCWGRNPSGQLGDGSTTSRHTPTAVSGWDSLAALPFIGRIFYASMNSPAARSAVPAGSRVVMRLAHGEARITDT